MDDGYGVVYINSDERPDTYQVRIRLDADVEQYFARLADKEGIPRQNLISLYLKDCMKHERKLNMEWS